MPLLAPHLASVLQSLRPEVDGGHLAIGFIHERFNACASVESIIKTPRALGNLLRSHELTFAPGKHRANGKVAVRCLLWDHRTESFLESYSLREGQGQCLQPGTVEDTGFVDIGAASHPGNEDVASSPHRAGATEAEVATPPSPAPMSTPALPADCGNVYTAAAMSTTSATSTPPSMSTEPAPSMFGPTQEANPVDKRGLLCFSPPTVPLSAPPGNCVAAAMEFIEICRRGYASLHITPAKIFYFKVPDEKYNIDFYKYLLDIWCECENHLLRMTDSGEVDNFGIIKRHRKTPDDESWPGRLWIMQNMDELKAKGWTRNCLFNVSKYTYPFGDWGLLWNHLWMVSKDVAISDNGGVVFTIHESRRTVQQTKRPKNRR